MKNKMYFRLFLILLFHINICLAQKNTNVDFFNKDLLSFSVDSFIKTFEIKEYFLAEIDTTFEYSGSRNWLGIVYKSEIKSYKSEAILNNGVYLMFAIEFQTKEYAQKLKNEFDLKTPCYPYKNATVLTLCSNDYFWFYKA